MPGFEKKELPSSKRKDVTKKHVSTLINDEVATLLDEEFKEVDRDCSIAEITRRKTARRDWNQGWVIKKESIVGRGVDLSKFDCCKKLIEELEGMFHIEGDLSDLDKGWKVSYIDDERDMMHIGDDPWMEFCRMVQKIYIFSPEEVRTIGLSGQDSLHQRRVPGV